MPCKLSYLAFVWTLTYQRLLWQMVNKFLTCTLPLIPFHSIKGQGSQPRRQRPLSGSISHPQRNTSSTSTLGTEANVGLFITTIVYEPIVFKTTRDRYSWPGDYVRRLTVEYSTNDNSWLQSQTAGMNGRASGTFGLTFCIHLTTRHDWSRKARAGGAGRN